MSLYAYNMVQIIMCVFFFLYFKFQENYIELGITVNTKTSFLLLFYVIFYLYFFYLFFLQFCCQVHHHPLTASLDTVTHDSQEETLCSPAALQHVCVFLDYVSSEKMDVRRVMGQKTFFHKPLLLSFPEVDSQSHSKHK